MNRIPLPRRIALSLTLAGALAALPAAAAQERGWGGQPGFAPRGAFGALWDGARALLRSLWHESPIQEKNGGSLDPWGQPTATLPTAPPAANGVNTEPLGHP